MFLFWKNFAKYEQLKIFLPTSWKKVLNAECELIYIKNILSKCSKCKKSRIFMKIIPKAGKRKISETPIL